MNHERLQKTYQLSFHDLNFIDLMNKLIFVKSNCFTLFIYLSKKTIFPVYSNVRNRRLICNIVRWNKIYRIYIFIFWQISEMRKSGWTELTRPGRVTGSGPPPDMTSLARFQTASPITTRTRTAWAWTRTITSSGTPRAVTARLTTSARS